VRDQNGIRPDVTVAPEEASALEEALRREAAFFFFANHYAAQQDTITAAFEATDQTLAAFRGWLDAENVQYTTSAERSVTQLSQALDEAGGYENTSDEVAALQQALDEAKQDDFTEHAEALKRRLRTEILSRTTDRRIQIADELDHDRQVDTAVGLLQDQDRYTAILTPDSTEGK
jgi:carboxyl-terminal processing protease